MRPWCKAGTTTTARRSAPTRRGASRGLQNTRTSAEKLRLDHLLLGEKGQLSAREAKLATQDLDVVLTHERRTA
jgi:hypothetical protein